MGGGGYRPATVLIQPTVWHSNWESIHSNGVAEVIMHATFCVVYFSYAIAVNTLPIAMPYCNISTCCRSKIPGLPLYESCDCALQTEVIMPFF